MRRRALLIALLLLAAPAGAETTRTLELVGPVTGLVVDAGSTLRYYAIGPHVGRFDPDPRALRLTSRALTFSSGALTLTCPLAPSTRTTERGSTVTTHRTPLTRTTTRLAWRSRTIRELVCTLTVGADVPVLTSARYEALTLTESTHETPRARALPPLVWSHAR